MVVPIPCEEETTSLCWCFAWLGFLGPRPLEPGHWSTFPSWHQRAITIHASLPTDVKGDAQRAFGEVYKQLCTYAGVPGSERECPVIPHKDAESRRTAASAASRDASPGLGGMFIARVLDGKGGCPAAYCCLVGPEASFQGD